MQEKTSSPPPVRIHTDSAPSRRPGRRFRRVFPEGDYPLVTLVFPWERHVKARAGLICLAVVIAVGMVLIPAFRIVRNTGSGSLQGQAPGQGNPGGEGASTAGYGGSDLTDDPVTDTTGGYAETAHEPPASETLPAVCPRPDETESASSVEITAAPEETVREPETTRPIPDGCYPIISLDGSERDRGAGYIAGNTAAIPGRLPVGGLWDTPPTVLIVHTHPYEGYSDGSAWYNPAEGGLAVTDTPNAVDGTVALGATLTRVLRNYGWTVIHLRIAVSAEDTATDIYTRTETVIRYYCKLYPDIGLVLNLRRSAELTPEGGILRTEGSFGGKSCAQVRISVNGGRSEAAVGRDLAVALAWREGLWDLEPSLSRPVWVKNRGGLISDLSDVCVLTLDMGAAGNTYAESKRLVEPLAAVLDELLRENP